MSNAIPNGMRKGRPPGVAGVKDRGRELTRAYMSLLAKAKGKAVSFTTDELRKEIARSLKKEESSSTVREVWRVGRAQLAVKGFLAADVVFQDGKEKTLYRVLAVEGRAVPIPFGAFVQLPVNLRKRLLDDTESARQDQDYTERHMTRYADIGLHLLQHQHSPEESDAREEDYHELVAKVLRYLMEGEEERYIVRRDRKTGVARLLGPLRTPPARLTKHLAHASPVQKQKK